MKKRKIFILLTKFYDTGSKLLRFATGTYYTHASIGLEEDMNTFYSFVLKGFIEEKITRYNKPGRIPMPCSLYELEVSNKIYREIKKEIKVFSENKNDFRYARLSLFFSILHIPFRQKYGYFCSQFVAHILEYAKAVELRKNSALYLPGDLDKIPGIKLNFKGNLLSMMNHFGIKRTECAA